ncbi:MAG TPA: hypothetical protein VGC42_16025 [Kofleriaceae bacterium]
MCSRRGLLGASAVLAALASYAGCSDLCARSSDCASGLVCSVAGACVVPPSDASAGGDGGTTTPTTDAAITDAATDDAAGDAGTGDPDAAQLDARVGT